MRPEWHAMNFSDLEQERPRLDRDGSRTSPFIPNTDQVRGFVYDVETGRLSEVS